MYNYIKTLFAVLLISVSTAWADNSIYVDQVGDSTTITINQDGNGNQIGGVSRGAGGLNVPSTSNRASLYGSNQYIDIKQIGNSNKLGINLQDSGTGSTVAYYNNGNNNVGTLDSVSTNIGNTFQTYISGSNNNTDQMVRGDGNNLFLASNYYDPGQYLPYGTGNNNVFNTQVNGSGNSINMATLGSNNQIYAYQGMNTGPGIVLNPNGVNALDSTTWATGATSDNSVLTLRNNGSNNLFLFGQSGTQSAIVGSVGDFNSLSLAQSGNAENYFTLNSSGNNNLLNVVQTSAGSTSGIINITSSGNSNTYTINQNTH